MPSSAHGEARPAARIVRYTGREDSRVAGTVLELSDAELAAADQTEPAGYARVLGRLHVQGEEALGLRRRDGAARSATPADPGRFATSGRR